MAERVARVEVFSITIPRETPYLGALREGERINDHGYIVRKGNRTVYPTVDRTVVVRIETANGAVGWGEATPTPRWTYETTETIVSTLRKYLAPAVKGIEIWNFDALHRAMDRAISPGVTPGSPLAKSAIDVAAWTTVSTS